MHDEAGHISALRTVLESAAPSPYLVTDFDYSGGGTGDGPLKNALLPGSTGNANGALFFAAARLFSTPASAPTKAARPR